LIRTSLIISSECGFVRLNKFEHFGNMTKAQPKLGKRQSSIGRSTPVKKAVVSEAERKEAHAKLMAYLYLMKEKITKDIMLARTPPEVPEIDSPNPEPA
jgi:hypothetical protein